MSIKRFISKCISFYYILRSKARPSFAQVGEDAILYYLFNNAGIKNISYLDIGTNHPVYGNNTYAFYLNGGHGVCIEPDPVLCRLIQKKRKKDVCLNVGIGVSDQKTSDFYIFSNTGWNTFSKQEAIARKETGQPYKKIIQIPLLDINKIIQDHFVATPDLISIDVEGLDFDILKSLNFDRHSPNVLIVETLRFGETNQALKHHDMIEFVCSKGYDVYADTFVNTIFCKKTFIND